MDQLEKLKELLNDKEFVDKALKLQSAQEVSNLFAENDVDISPEQLMEVKELLNKKINGELTDEDLEGVAGGIVTIICGVASVAALIGSCAFMAWASGW